MRKGRAFQGRIQGFGLAAALAAGFPAACGGGTSSGNDAGCSTTCTIGATQCEGTQLGTCTSVNGCNAYVSVACPIAGQTCIAATNMCGTADPCSPTAVTAACAGAATNLNQCCGSTSATGPGVCASEVDAGKDPQTACTVLQTASCSTLHDDFYAAHDCCCPTSQFCWAQDAGECIKDCIQASDCASGACAPATEPSGNPHAGFPYICKPNSGAPYEGCFGLTVSCGGAYCCVADANGNQFCALPCTDSSTCGGGTCNTYDFSHTTCSGPKACGS